LGEVTRGIIGWLHRLQMIDLLAELRTDGLRVRLCDKALRSVLFFLDESVELLEVKEAVADALLILLLDDEIMSLEPLVLHLLFLVLAHQLSECAVELADILGEQLAITEYLHEQLLLVLLPDEAALDAEAFVGHLLPAVVEDLLRPNPPLLLLLVPLDLQIALLQGKLPDLPLEVLQVVPARLEEHLIWLHDHVDFCFLEVNGDERQLVVRGTLS
jgi:hypothetical protein